MIFKDICYANFFSVTEEIHLPLQNQGLVLVTGENHDSSAADSNGSGKSTIFEALVWCLWGRTVRGESGDAVININAKKDCYVFLTMLDGTQEYTVKRFRNHHQFKNSLQLWSGSTDISEGTSTLTQTKVDELLSIDFDSFIRGPMQPQGAFKRFSQMTDSEQKAIMETAMQLGVLPAALEIVKDQINRVQLTMQAITTQLHNLQHEHALVTDDLVKVTKERDSINHKLLMYKATTLNSTLWAIEKYDEAWDSYEPVIDCWPLEGTLLTLEDLNKKLVEQWDKDLTLINAEVVVANSEFLALQNNLKDARVSLASLKKLEIGSACPTCLQQVTAQNVDGCISALETKIVDISLALDQSKEQYNRKLEKQRLRRRSASESIERSMAMVHQAKDNLSAAKNVANKNAECDKSIEATSAVLAIRITTNIFDPHMDWIIQEKTEKLGDINSAIKRVQANAGSSDNLLQHLYFWKTGFSNSGLKSRILQSITPFMNKQADIFIRDLTDGELQITFNTQTQLKSGQMREQFSVEVTNKNGARTYDGSSGGEKARADLAITLTLSDLVASRSKKSYPQRWFDEPFEALDEAGIEAVMELLAKMVTNCGTIFVITHQDTMKSLFNKVITVAKRNGVTKLVA